MRTSRILREFHMISKCLKNEKIQSTNTPMKKRPARHFVA
jgi:hypothetical protein